MNRMMHCCALSMEIHIPASRSLKSKRRVVRHLLERRVGHGSAWLSPRLGIRTAGSEAHSDSLPIGSSPGQVEDVLDTVQRYVWSHHEVNVLEGTRCWLEHGC